MDSLLTASARALAAGDALGALKRVALRDDPPALALRGIAMAQLGEYPRARELLRDAARRFGANEQVARARCVVAEAEVALALRDLAGSTRPLASALESLQSHGDHANAQQGRLVAARRALLLGRLDVASGELAHVAIETLPPALAAVAELVAAELAMRGLRSDEARAALARAQQQASRSGVPALLAEVGETRAAFARPAARRRTADGEVPLRIAEVAALLAADTLVVDACRRRVGAAGDWQSLARRPILFMLARALAQAWPGDVERQALIADVFRTRRPDETHRARLRVEIGRLRGLLAPLASIEATAQGYALHPLDGREVVVLAPPVEGEQGVLLALLSDGAAWSTSALAQATGASQRTVQRALAELESEGRVRALGRARARRWLAPPLAGFTTILLLPSALPLD